MEDKLREILDRAKIVMQNDPIAEHLHYTAGIRETLVFPDGYGDDKSIGIEFEYECFITVTKPGPYGSSVLFDVSDDSLDRCIAKLQRLARKAEEQRNQDREYTEEYKRRRGIKT